MFSASLIPFIFVPSFLALSVDLLSFFSLAFSVVVCVFLFLLIFVFTPINVCSKKDIRYGRGVVLFIYAYMYIIYIFTKNL